MAFHILKLYKTEMQTTLCSDNIEDYEHHLCYGKEYYISNAKVKQIDKRYRTLPHDYHLEYYHKKVIEPVEEFINETSPKYQSLDELPNHANPEE